MLANDPTTLALVDGLERIFSAAVVLNCLLMVCSELLLLLLDPASVTYAALTQPLPSTRYQVLLPLTLVPCFWATALKVALFANDPTTLALVDGLERIFKTAVVLNCLLMVCSELLLLLLDPASVTYAALTQPLPSTRYQVLLPLTLVPCFWATALKVVLLANDPTTLALVEASERIFSAAVVLNCLLIVCSELLVLLPFPLPPPVAESNCVKL